MSGRKLGAALLAAVVVAGPVRADTDTDVCAYSGNYDLREAACSRIIARDTSGGQDVLWAYANRCKARHNLSKLEAAVDDCNFVLGRDPDHWQSLDNRAIAYHKLRRYRPSLDSINAALRVNPGNFEAYNTKGNALCGLGRSYEALEAYRVAARHKALPALAWQKFLKNGGYYNGLVDGKFGPKSLSALERWAVAECR